jgi:N-methylhydantoinase B/oxoprolinase/acetone carboxylase alpha subunit
MEEGGAYIAINPYSGGTHLPDINKVVTVKTFFQILESEKTP